MNVQRRRGSGISVSFEDEEMVRMVRLCLAEEGTTQRRLYALPIDMVGRGCDFETAQTMWSVCLDVGFSDVG